MKFFIRPAAKVTALQFNGKNADDLATFCPMQLHKQTERIFSLISIGQLVIGDWLVRDDEEVMVCSSEMFPKKFKEIRTDEPEIRADGILTLEETKKQYFVNLIKICHGKVEAIAEKAGICRASVYRVFEEYDLANERAEAIYRKRIKE